MISGIGTHEIPSSHLTSGILRSAYTNNLVPQFAVGGDYPYGWVPGEHVDNIPNLDCINFSVVDGALRVETNAEFPSEAFPTHISHSILFPLPVPIDTGEYYRFSFELREDNQYQEDLYYGFADSPARVQLPNEFFGGTMQPITGGDWSWVEWGVGLTQNVSPRLNYFVLQTDLAGTVVGYPKIFEIRRVNIEKLRG